MNTQSHILMGAILFGRPLPRRALAGAAGGLIADIPMFVIVALLRMGGYSFDEIFGRIYWEQWWQVLNAVGHSFLIWGVLTLVAWLVIRRHGAAQAPRAALCFAFAGSALLHSVIDFLVHREDAHMQFWPLTEWRFVSPVSYWDPAHYGNWFSLFEAALGLVMAVMLFRRYRNVLARIALAIAILLYVSAPAFFLHHLG